jgi:hypothetical protein
MGTAGLLLDGPAAFGCAPVHVAAGLVEPALCP